MYKRQIQALARVVVRRPHDAQFIRLQGASPHRTGHAAAVLRKGSGAVVGACLLYTSTLPRSRCCWMKYLAEFLAICLEQNSISATMSMVTLMLFCSKQIAKNSDVYKRQAG